MTMFDFNIYVQNGVSSIRNYARNRKVESIIDAATSIDSIVDFSAFREYVIKLKRDVIKEGAPFGLGKSYCSHPTSWGDSSSSQTRRGFFFA